MKNPSEWIPTAQRKRAFWLLLAATLTVMVIMNLAGAPLTTPAAPLGIVSFEVAGSPAQAQAILESWNPTIQRYAAFGLGFDYVFMLAYASVIGLACLMAGESLRARGWPLASLGRNLSWGQWLAAILDAIENLGLTLVLLNNAASPWPEIARWCALSKFALLFLGLVYALFGLVAYLVERHPA